MLIVHVRSALFLMFLDLKKFLDESNDKTAKRQVEIEQKFLQSEQSVSCLKPPRKKKKLNAQSKKMQLRIVWHDWQHNYSRIIFNRLVHVFSCSVVFLR